MKILKDISPFTKRCPWGPRRHRLSHPLKGPVKYISGKDYLCLKVILHTFKTIHSFVCSITGGMLDLNW